MYLAFIRITYHFVYSLRVEENTDCICCLATKEVEIPLLFKYIRIALPWKQIAHFKQEIDMSEGLFVVFVKDIFAIYLNNLSYCLFITCGSLLLR